MGTVWMIGIHLFHFDCLLLLLCFRRQSVRAESVGFGGRVTVLETVTFLTLAAT